MPAGEGDVAGVAEDRGERIGIFCCRPFCWVERGELHVCEVAILAWGSLQVMKSQSLLFVAALVVFK